MNIVVQFKQNDFVLFIIMDNEKTLLVDTRTEREFFQYLTDSNMDTPIKIIGSEKRKILEILENDKDAKLCMERKYPVETPQMSRNLRYYNVFKIR